MASDTTQIFIDLIARDKASKQLAKSALTLGAIGLASLKFAKDSVKAFSESEQAQLRLTDAYAKFPKITDVSLQSLDDLSKSLQKKTKFDDEATKSAEALLAKFNLTGKQIETLIPLVQDYAAATGQDLGAATESIGKAFEGNARALKAVGINFKATGDTAKDFTTIQADLSEKVGGFAEKQGKTAAGQAAILANQYNDLQETVGSLLVPALTSLVNIIEPVVEAFNELPVPVKNTALGVGLVAGAVLVVIPRLLAMKVLLQQIGHGGAEAAVGLDATAAATTGIGTATTAALPKLTTLLGLLGKVAGALAVAAVVNEQWDKSNVPLLVHLRDVSGRADNLYDVVQKNVTAQKALTVATTDSTGIYGFFDRILHRTSGSTEEVGKKQQKTGEVTKQTTHAVVDQAAAYNKLVISLDTLIGKQEGGVRASIAQREAHRAAIAAIKDMGTTAHASGATVDAAFGAILDAANAAADATKGAANKNKAYYDTLTELRKHVSKNSPLYKDLTDYINHLKAIPKSIDTRINLTLSLARKQAYASGIHAAGAASFQIKILAETAPARAAGGPVYAGHPYTVGEAGPELFVPSTSGRIVPNGGGSGGTTYMTVNVYTSNPTETVRAIQKYERMNGKGWRS